jgi:serine/threonine protein kinase
VAIKVLPTSVAGDADRLARFQREAEVLAALNHPNIGAIYGLEKTEAPRADEVAIARTGATGRAGLETVSTKEI